MQIYSANTFTPQSSLVTGNDNQAQVQDHRDRLVVQKEQPKNSQENSQQSQQPRLDIDPKAIELVEKNLQANIDNSNFTKTQANHNYSGYDQPSQVNRSAVSAYQSVGNIEERDNIQQAFGVDLFA